MPALHLWSLVGPGAVASSTVHAPWPKQELPKTFETATAEPRIYQWCVSMRVLQNIVIICQVSTGLLHILHVQLAEAPNVRGTTLNETHGCPCTRIPAQVGVRWLLPPSGKCPGPLLRHPHASPQRHRKAAHGTCHVCHNSGRSLLTGAAGLSAMSAQEKKAACHGEAVAMKGGSRSGLCWC